MEIKNTKYICDRCGSEIEKYPYTFLQSFFDLNFVERFAIGTIRNTKKCSDKKDLCKSCYDSFHNWFYEKGIFKATKK